MKKEILKDAIVSNFNQKTPSLDFTDLVMQKVETLAETELVVAPLISKKVWLISIVIGLLVVLSSFGVEIQKVELTLFDKLNFKLPQLSDFEVTIKLMAVIFSVFLVMTLADVFYRKSKKSNTSY